MNPSQRNKLNDLVRDLDDAHAVITRRIYQSGYDFRADDALHAVKVAADFLFNLKHESQP
jgi:hypothetical protein